MLIKLALSPLMSNENNVLFEQTTHRPAHPFPPPFCSLEWTDKGQAQSPASG